MSVERNISINTCNFQILVSGSCLFLIDPDVQPAHTGNNSTNGPRDVATRNDKGSRKS
jgi:hypothetical protein